MQYCKHKQECTPIIMSVQKKSKAHHRSVFFCQTRFQSPNVPNVRYYVVGEAALASMKYLLLTLTGPLMTFNTHVPTCVNHLNDLIWQVMKSYFFCYAALQVPTTNNAPILQIM